MVHMRCIALELGPQCNVVWNERCCICSFPDHRLDAFMVHGVWLPGPAAVGEVQQTKIDIIALDLAFEVCEGTSGPLTFAN